MNLEQSYKLAFTDYLTTKFDRKKTTPLNALAEGSLQWDEQSQKPWFTKPIFRRFKPYLNAILPFLAPDTQQWEPKIHISDTEEFPLVVIRQFLSKTLKSLTSASDELVTCSADGLTTEFFQAVLRQLAGVAINQPVGSSEAYRFNLREAVLSAELVQDASRIYFVEEAIAALLAELHHQSSVKPGLALVVSAGTSITELVLADIPTEPHTLSRNDLFLRRLAYAGNALDQDIICQLLHPLAQGWESLKLDTLDLPLPGEPDLEARFRLQQRLESCSLGQNLLKVVRQIKPLLCQQDLSFSMENSEWTLRQQDLYNWVIAPYLQQLNREITLLLTQAGINSSAIKTVICTGGTLTIPAIGNWLQEKFSDAIAIRDTIADQGKMSEQRVANGLSVLPQFPLVLDTTRHQYNEYFLLRETLKTLPDQAEKPYSHLHIQKLLEEKGIPANACGPFLKNLLEGQLPTGLVVTKASTVLLSPNSTQQVSYQALTAAPLFTRQGQVYRLNRPQRDRLWNHLQIILANAHQTLDVASQIQLESNLADSFRT